MATLSLIAVYAFVLVLTAIVTKVASATAIRLVTGVSSLRVTLAVVWATWLLLLSTSVLLPFATAIEAAQSVWFSDVPRWMMSAIWLVSTVAGFWISSVLFERTWRGYRKS